MHNLTDKSTKIVATLGPASSDVETIKELILAGANIFRLNFSHGVADDHKLRAQNIRTAAKELDISVAIMADLQGPKIRIAQFKNKKVTLKVGAPFCLDGDLDLEVGDETQVGIIYKHLPKDVHAGDKLLLDDGRIVFAVTHIDGNKVHCTVDVGGELSNNKGINKLGGGLSAECLTEKDKADLITAVGLDVAYIAISFPRSAQDMIHARELVSIAGGDSRLVAKLERAEAMHCIDEIIEASDAVMVARGDLGVEIGDAALPAAQKHIIKRARALNTAVITATQMMESMIEHSIPTRAEVFDVANAVLDYSDAVMLSAETATGNHPAEVVRAMSRICLGAESSPETKISKHRVECFFEGSDESIAMAAMYTANHSAVKAIVSITASGDTPLLMSRIKTGIPIFAFSPLGKTLRRMCMFRGVFPVPFSLEGIDNNNVYQKVVDTLLANKQVSAGDKILVTCGDFVGQRGSTNTLKVISV
jgi:pyruvate kinase